MGSQFRIRPAGVLKKKKKKKFPVPPVSPLSVTFYLSNLTSSPSLSHHGPTSRVAASQAHHLFPLRPSREGWLVVWRESGPSAGTAEGEERGGEVRTWRLWGSGRIVSDQQVKLSSEVSPRTCHTWPHNSSRTTVQICLWKNHYKTAFRHSHLTYRSITHTTIKQDYFLFTESAIQEM